MKTIGIDPGTARMGWGVVEERGSQIILVEFGVLTTPAGMAQAERLRLLYDGLSAILGRHQPTYAAVEELFFGKNVNTAITVGQARGVVLLALNQAGADIYEYKPTVVKQAITGYGGADKRQMQEMVRITLGLATAPRPDDAADALAVAICHAYTGPTLLRPFEVITMSSRRRPGAPCDLEELRPGLFIIHNPALGPTLRGEGDREGDRFTLTSWRGEGLIARLRARSFSVLTLADQVGRLPGLPTVAPPGEPQARKLAAGERVSYFAADPLGWAPAPEAAPGEVTLREGWALRRRRSRGSFSYHQLVGGALAPRDEDTALRIGYAQASISGPLAIMATPGEGGHILPDIPLPTAYRRLLGRAAAQTPQGWIVPAEGLPVVAAILARLRITLIADC